MDALTLLLERSSSPRLVAPAPSGSVLDKILAAGLRVPDHGHLQPWQFIISEGEGRARLGAVLAAAATARGESDVQVERARQAPLRAPMVITVVARVQSHPNVPPLEQQLSAGCAVMAMQMAAQAQGFGGMWRSGWFMFDRRVHAGLGLEEQDQIVGFLYLGTPADNPATKSGPMPEAGAFIRYF